MSQPRFPMPGKNKKPVKKSSAKPTLKKKVAVKPAGKSAAKTSAKPTAKGASKVPAKAILKKKEAGKPIKKASVKEDSKVEKKSLLKKAAGKVFEAAKKAISSKETPAPKESLKVKKPGKEKIEDEAVVEAQPVAAAPEDEEVVLTDAEGRRYCRVKDCDQLAVVDGYCRYHYLLFWKKIQVRKKILSEGKLERYIEDLTARYPDKFLDMLRKDLRSEKEFLAAIAELEIDESSVDNEFEDETQNYLDEVRGMGSEAVATRDDDDF